MSIARDFMAALTDGPTDTGTAVAQYSESFSRLWSDSWADEFGATPGKQRVLVWDGAPAGNELLLKHLTPLDWALAVSMRTLTDPHADTRWSLHVVDLSLSTGRDCWAQLHAAALLDAMPWVRLYGPLHLKRRAYDARRLEPVLLRQTADTPTLAGCLGSGREARVQTLRHLAQSWQGSIQRSEDHHDLNNLVAPVLLARECAGEADDRALSAFAKKSRWLGLLSADGLNERLMAESVETVLGTLPDRSTVRVTMVDDMANRGWGELVRRWLGAPQTVPFEAHTSPGLLVELLDLREAKNFKERSYSQSVWVADGEVPVDEVLIWDLRLFGRGFAISTTDRRNEERCFYAQLVAAIRRCGLIDTTKLAWPGFTSEEIAAVEKWCGATGSDEPPEAALTLAPRCMALLSPTTPIIVLSATNRRSIIEALKPYGNILTGLEKPRPLDQFARDVDHLLQQWQTVWSHVGVILAMRRRLRHVAALWSQLGREQPARSGSSNRVPYVEIYIDESEVAGRFWLGGVIAIFDSVSDANYFDDVMFKSGVCYYDPLVSRSPVPVPIKPKKPDGGSSLELAKGRKTFIESKRSLALHRFAMRFATPLDHDAAEPIRRSGDFLYFQTAATAIELLLYDLLPTSLDERVFTVAVYVGTRHLGNQSKLDLLRHKRDFGYSALIGPRASSAMLESVSGNSVLPVLARIMTERPTINRFSVDRAMGVTLKYERQGAQDPMLPTRFVCRQPGCLEVALVTHAEVQNTVRESRIPQNSTGHRTYAPVVSAVCTGGRHQWVPDYRALHYVADEFVLEKEFSSYREAGCVDAGLPGFDEEADDPQLRDLLLASRLADRGESVIALIRAFSSIGNQELQSLSPLRRVLVAKLFKASQRLSGSDVFKVGYALPNVPVYPQLGVMPAGAARRAYQPSGRARVGDSSTRAPSTPPRTEPVTEDGQLVVRFESLSKDEQAMGPGRYSERVLGLQGATFKVTNTGNWKFFFLTAQQMDDVWGRIAGQVGRSIVIDTNGAVSARLRR